MTVERVFFSTARAKDLEHIFEQNCLAGGFRKALTRVHDKD